MSEQQQVADNSKAAPTHHFGRGGAGNKTSRDPKSPMVVPAVTPTLKENMYTTGRGGTGNMAKNDPDRPEEARAAQDVDDIPTMSLPEGPRTIGRGGVANVHRPSVSERKMAEETNKAMRMDATKDKSTLKTLTEKGKELLTGKKDANA